jgi:hypothetical protein
VLGEAAIEQRTPKPSVAWARAAPIPPLAHWTFGLGSPTPFTREGHELFVGTAFATLAQKTMG